MDLQDYKKGKLMVLKDDLDRLSREELNAFLFEFIKEPLAYAIGRFSGELDLSESVAIAKDFSEGKKTERELFAEVDYLLTTISSLDDPYDREVLYSVASSFLALLYREHAFDAILHDLDSIVIDSGREESLSLIPSRIDHHSQTINKVRNNRSNTTSYNRTSFPYSKLIV